MEIPKFWHIMTETVHKHMDTWPSWITFLDVEINAFEDRRLHRRELLLILIFNWKSGQEQNIHFYFINYIQQRCKKSLHETTFSEVFLFSVPRPIWQVYTYESLLSWLFNICVILWLSLHKQSHVISLLHVIIGLKFQGI